MTASISAAGTSPRCLFATPSVWLISRCKRRMTAGRFAAPRAAGTSLPTSYPVTDKPRSLRTLAATDRGRSATRLLAAWLVLPFVYLSAVGVGFLASYLAVVKQIGEVSSGGYFLIFWMFQNPPDLLFSVIKGMAMATAIVAVGCYYGYTASGGPVGVGQATAKSMILNMVLVHLIGMMGSQIFWGANPRAPIGG